MAKFKVGDFIDPIETGNSAIDVKKLLRDNGYVVDCAIDNIPLYIYPAIVITEIDAIKVKKQSLLHYLQLLNLYVAFAILEILHLGEDMKAEILLYAEIVI